jgi:hypothetical protein
MPVRHSEYGMTCEVHETDVGVKRHVVKNYGWSPVAMPRVKPISNHDAPMTT